MVSLVPRTLLLQCSVEYFADGGIASDINAAFHSDGVLTRLLSPLPLECSEFACEPWMLDLGNSFSLMSPESWNSRSQSYAVYPGHNMTAGIGPKPLRQSGFPGFIAHARALEMINCAFPADGYVGCRWNNNCGCANKDVPGCPVAGVVCKQPNHEDWCTSAGASSFCAYRASEMSLMLRAFDARKGKFDDPLNAYNEVLVNRAKWAEAVPSIIWAFVVPDACSPTSNCYSQWYGWYTRFRQKYGQKPIVGFNARNRANPYYDMPDTHVTPSHKPTESPIAYVPPSQGEKTNTCITNAVVGHCFLKGCFGYQGRAYCHWLRCMCKATFCSVDHRHCIEDPTSLVATSSFQTGRQQSHSVGEAVIVGFSCGNLVLILLLIGSRIFGPQPKHQPLLA